MCVSECTHATRTYMQACTECPTNTQAPAGSTSRTQCLCVPGYYHTNFGYPNDECRRCDGGSYISTVGSTSCIQCPSDAASSADSSTCLCSIGAFVQGICLRSRVRVLACIAIHLVSLHTQRRESAHTRTEGVFVCGLQASASQPPHPAQRLLPLPHPLSLHP